MKMLLFREDESYCTNLLIGERELPMFPSEVQYMHENYPFQISS